MLSWHNSELGDNVLLITLNSKTSLHLGGLNLFDSPKNEITIYSCSSLLGEDLGILIMVYLLPLLGSQSSLWSPIVIHTLYFNDSFIKSLIEHMWTHIFKCLLCAPLWVMYRKYGSPAASKINAALALGDLLFFFPD